MSPSPPSSGTAGRSSAITTNNFSAINRHGRLEMDAYWHSLAMASNRFVYFAITGAARSSSVQKIASGTWINLERSESRRVRQGDGMVTYRGVHDSLVDCWSRARRVSKANFPVATFTTSTAQPRIRNVLLTQHYKPIPSSKSISRPSRRRLAS
jgi:hypothetical protein